ncbi:helix-turn-helix transcriptional regulator [Fulvivirga sediminis]|uniref:YafY family transcriptional regulator n=1 Tax=Fulvivirga sediminis TaxID=2803949 RepID=A0A937FAI3_9BACT|nr:YafY family protein [Fulvivirga sediminis]MBL3657028.1 YafY family transcriptional regulator [Fulvivirga sediminis]
MNRIDRLSAILIQLQSKRVVTAKMIADRFDISLRTVYRDIRALEEAGIPIGAEAGVGYFLMEGYHLPPVSFTKEEAGAILIAAKLAERHADHSIQHHFENALFKIKAILKIQEKEYLNTLEANTKVLTPPNKPLRNNSFPDHFISDLQTALAKHKVVSFEYFSTYNQNLSHREVEPVNLCFYSNHWHLIAYCRLRQAMRDFRTDRITKLQIREETYTPHKSSDHQKYVNNLILGTDLKKVIVQMDKRVALYLGDQKYYMGLIEEKDKGEDMEMTFMTSHMEYFGRWLLSLGTRISPVGPSLLIETMKALTSDMYKHYHKHSDKESN